MIIKSYKCLKKDIINLKNKNVLTLVKYSVLTGLNLYITLKHGLNPCFPYTFIGCHCLRLNVFYVIRKHYNKKLSKQFKNNVKILDFNVKSLKSYSIYCKNNVPLNSIDQPTLEHCINATLTKIDQGTRKNRFLASFNRGKQMKYMKLEKGSLQRLESVLLTYVRNNVEKVRYIKSHENDVEISHEFSCDIPVKRMNRELINIEHKLGCKKGFLSITQDNGVYTFSIKKDNVKTYLLDDYIGTVSKPRKMQLPFILGVNYKNGNVVVNDLMEVLHLLIAGKTGSGKSVTAKGVIESLMYWNQNCSFYMLDFTESALTRYEDFGNVKYVEPYFDKVKDSIFELRQEMNNRKNMFKGKYENIKEYNQCNNKIPYLIYCIDEANGFKEDFDKKEFEEIEKPMKALLKRGRKYGIIVIFIVQQTNDNDFCKSWRTQTTRLGHLLSDTVDCNNLTTNKEVAQLLPNLGKGEFFLVQEGKPVEKMKGCFTSKEHNKLYQVLKEVYTVENKIETKVNLEKTEEAKKTYENQEERQENTTSDTHKNTSIA